jgi:hypothetical protein
MKLPNWVKPWTWFKKSVPSVYFETRLDGPFVDVHESEPDAPWVRILNIPEENARSASSINWDLVPHSIRAPLEKPPYSLEIEWDKIKEWII